METVPAAPLRIVMSPERVSTSRSTGPLTWNDTVESSDHRSEAGQCTSQHETENANCARSNQHEAILQKSGVWSQLPGLRFSGSVFS